MKKEIKRKQNRDNYSLVNTEHGKTDCRSCIFGNKGECLLATHATTLSANDEDEMFKICNANKRMHWEKVEEETEIHDLSVGSIPVMNIGDTINLNGCKYKLEECIPHPDNETKCNQCIFGALEGHCCLKDEDNILKYKANELIVNCERESTAVYKLIKANELDAHSSTGVVNPNTDNAPKEPNTNIKRHIDVILTLDEARSWYYSMNPILKDLAVRAFTPAELEDVRKCTMNIDIKTAKRLYRNAEKAVRNFVLSAFTEDELKD